MESTIPAWGLTHTSVERKTEKKELASLPVGAAPQIPDPGASRARLELVRHRSLTGAHRIQLTSIRPAREPRSPLPLARQSVPVGHAVPAGRRLFLEGSERLSTAAESRRSSRTHEQIRARKTAFCPGSLTRRAVPLLPENQTKGALIHSTLVLFNVAGQLPATRIGALQH